MVKTKRILFYIAGIQAIGQSHKLGPGVSNTPSATSYTQFVYR